jgi:hypothetical protein
MEEDITRSPQILEVIRSTESNAQLYVYEMHQERRSNGTHQSYYVDYNGFTVNPEQVNSAYLYSLLPYKDTQKYGDYTAQTTRRCRNHNPGVHAQQAASLQRGPS